MGKSYWGGSKNSGIVAFFLRSQQQLLGEKTLQSEKNDISNNFKLAIALGGDGSVLRTVKPSVITRYPYSESISVAWVISQV